MRKKLGLNSSDKSLSEFLSAVTGTPLVRDELPVADDQEPDVAEPGAATFEDGSVDGPKVNGLTLTREQVERIKADERPVEEVESE